MLMAAVLYICAQYSDGSRECDMRASHNRQDVSLVECKNKLNAGVIEISKQLMAEEPDTLVTNTMVECVEVKDYATLLGTLPGVLQGLGYEKVIITFY